MQPTFFIPHGGGPAFFMDWNPADAWDKMKGFLAGIIPSLPERPKAIIVVTAHWEAPEVTVSTNPSPELYYDYYGFPKHTYEFTWKPKNDLAVANRALELLRSAGIGAQEDSERGYDHGVFIPMMVAVPDADIPIVQTCSPSFAHRRIFCAGPTCRTRGGGAMWMQSRIRSIVPQSLRGNCSPLPAARPSSQ
ncbi:MAG TPA: class III extradiol ring-cleavage dioxygenase, partial [Paracoccaceae bacterium]|nr:class III extradiol ring-cleavage dioxygenase [Paracoccaceae bacterium]